MSSFQNFICMKCFKNKKCAANIFFFYIQTKIYTIIIILCFTTYYHFYQQYPYAIVLFHIQFSQILKSEHVIYHTCRSLVCAKQQITKNRNANIKCLRNIGLDNLYLIILSSCDIKLLKDILSLMFIWYHGITSQISQRYDNPHQT